MGSGARRACIRGSSGAGCVYRYSPDRRAEHAEALLGSCRGFLHADGYAGFNSLFAHDPKSGKPRLSEAACWAHARRNIYEIYKSTTSPLAKEALERIAELFEIETRINGCAPQRNGWSCVSKRPCRCWLSLRAI